MGSVGNSPLYAIQVDDSRYEILLILEDLTRATLRGGEIDFDIEYTKVSGDD